MISSMTRFFITTLTLTLLFCNNNGNSYAATPIATAVENIAATRDQQERGTQSENYCKAHSIPVYSNPNALFIDPEEKVNYITK